MLGNQHLNILSANNKNFSECREMYVKPQFEKDCGVIPFTFPGARKSKMFGYHGK